LFFLAFWIFGDVEGYVRIEGLTVDGVVYIPLKCAYQHRKKQTKIWYCGAVIEASHP
jgi:hypothetical protein